LDSKDCLIRYKNGIIIELRHKIQELENNLEILKRHAIVNEFSKNHHPTDSYLWNKIIEIIEEENTENFVIVLSGKTIMIKAKNI